MKSGYLICENGNPIACSYMQHRDAVSGEITGNFSEENLYQNRLLQFQLENGTKLKIIRTANLTGKRSSGADERSNWTFELQLEPDQS